MSQTISPGAQKPYGVQRVCRIWDEEAGGGEREIYLK